MTRQIASDARTSIATQVASDARTTIQRLARAVRAMGGILMHEAAPVVVFARAPVPGAVKTRLIPALGAEGAAALSRVLTLRSIEAALAAGIGRVELWCAPDASHPFFAECARRYPILLATQGEGDLGARMLGAFSALLAANARVLLIGSDIPPLTPQYLRDADAALEAGADAVFGPAEDGGYVLIGLLRVAPELFDGIAWGGDEVWRRTRDRLEALAWRYRTLPALWDVDRPQDLSRLQGIMAMPVAAAMP